MISNIGNDIYYLNALLNAYEHTNDVSIFRDRTNISSPEINITSHFVVFSSHGEPLYGCLLLFTFITFMIESLKY